MASFFIPTRLNDLSVDVLLSSVARGDILYRGASKWNNLAAGTSGYFLKTQGAGADPTWAEVTTASGANPTASVGLSAVNGSAGTFLRSDGAPALSQAITPTWTGQHIWQVSNAAAVSVGPNGDTNPTLRVVTNVASAATGLSVTGNAAGSGVTLTAISSGSDENINLTPKGGGAVVLPNGVNTTGLRFSRGYMYGDSGKLAWGTDSTDYWYLDGDTFTARNNASISLGTSSLLFWSSAGLARNAAGVIEANNGTAGQYRWVLQAGHTRLTANATNATTTMANLTDLSVSLLAGRKYSFKLILMLNNALAADGVKVDFDGGTATMTSFRCHGTLFDTALLLSAQTSALATDFAQATVTGDAMFEFHGALVCNAAGTFIPRIAKNADAAGATLTTYANSFLVIEDMAA